MTRFQWKWAALAPVLALGMISCEEPTTSDDVDDSYPSNNLEVSANQNVLITEMTALDCGTCTPTQEFMEVMKAAFPGRIIPMSLQAGDTLWTEAMNDLYLTLGDDPAETTKLFINGILYTGNPIEPIIANLQTDTYLSGVGVAHATDENDTAWLIYPKVKFFANTTEDYYVQSYVMLDGAVAKPYGAVDLTQDVSNDSRLDIVNGTTTWTTNGGQVDSATYLYSNGTPYMHHDVTMYAGANDTNVYGLPLSVINPLGQNFLAGDIYGNQYTQIEIPVKKPEFDMIGHVNGDIKVATVIWKRIPGSPDLYVFENGYYSEF